MSQIKLKRGMKANLPNSLPLGEPAFCLDTQEMYVGQGKGKPLTKVNAQDFKEIDSKFKQTNAQLSNAIININDYQQYTTQVNGVCVWNESFNNAFLDLKNGGTLIIPDGNYYIDGRVVLTGKNGININCSGTILPVNGKTPLIGTLSIVNCDNAVINGLSLNGNKDNVSDEVGIGSQSLLEITNCQNLIFNNFSIQDTQESGMNSNGNLNNITFNNVFLSNIGEHGFYFGGSNCQNIRFNTLKAIDVGMNEPSKTRATGVIKFRNKLENDIMHDNIIVDGFYFESTDADFDKNKNFIQAFECKNVVLRNGEIVGPNTSIFATNILIDNMLIDNVHIDGKRVLHGLNKNNAWNEPQTIDKPGEMKIVIKNSTLKCGSNNFSDINLYQNCVFKLTTNYQDTMTTSINQKCTVENCEIDCGRYRFDINRIDCVFFRNVVFINLDTGSQPLINILCDTGSLINFSNVKTESEISLFCQTSNKIDLFFNDCEINGLIKSTTMLNQLKIINSKLKETRLNLYASFSKLVVNGVYELSSNTRKDFSVHKATCKSHNTNVNLTLKYNRISEVTDSNLIITNNRGIAFEYSISDNVVNLSTITPQNEDTIFTVIYSAL